MKELRVIAQLTIQPRYVSLIAEEDMHPYKKGQLVKRVTRKSVEGMKQPLTVKISAGGVKLIMHSSS